MNVQGHYTAKGLALAAKLSAGATLAITRVAAGSGITQDPAAATGLPQLRQQLAVNTLSRSGNTATLSAILIAAQAAESYDLTELGVYANDPDEGEILYKLYQTESPIYIASGSSMVLRFYLQESISEQLGAEVICSPGGLITEQEFTPLQNRVINREIPKKEIELAARDLKAYIYGLPRLLTETVEIKVSGETDMLDMANFSGPGRIIITAASDGCLLQEAYITRCAVPVVLSGLEITTDKALVRNPHGLVSVNASSQVSIQNCQIHAVNQQNGAALAADANSRVLVTGSSMKNFYTTLFAGGNSMVSVQGSAASFSGNTFGVQVYGGGIVLLGGSVPNTLGGSANINNGGLIISTTGVQIPAERRSHSEMNGMYIPT